ncbi:hypothetical protein PSTG_12405 [Puccinia striiformis f. sp. tritici PST-78]|uniref:Uncharacterized protein n=1 Tax=Puccinia striiformis f. sp. tritici PST-78 TaxID=1165861 RepID=A0A0L0V4R2_9BASI|nr:hypothetical protein PSTG_12405 [Puccinia striiformis f. sp. tritici PST-78]
MLPTLAAGKGSNSQLSEHLLCITIHIVHLINIKSGIHIYHYIVLRVDTPPFLNKSTTHYYHTHTLLSTTTLSINPSKIMFEINNHTPDLDQHSPNHSNGEDHASTKHCQKISSSNNERSPSSDNTSEPLSNTNGLDDTKSPLSPKDRRLKKLLPAREKNGIFKNIIFARPLSPEIPASILSSHSKGLNLREMNARLYADTGVEVGHRTNSTGYRRMRMVLMRHYNIRVPRDIIYEVLKEIDPKGMAARLCQACKCCIYRTLGPNHIWACDGHNKLKPFGITVYGFVDAWLQKVLGMFGTETVDMAAHQMTLSLAYAGISKEEAEKRMHFTKSTHNQKIEAMWSQMMKQHNRPIKDDILAEINSGCYDKDDGVQKLLFLFLWIPVFQASVDIWVDSYNHYRKRFHKLTTLPTGCTPDFAYTTPESFGTTDQLVRIPSQHIDCLSEQFYPDKEEMFLHTPLEFHEVASSVMAQLGLRQSLKAPYSGSILPPCCYLLATKLKAL